MEGQKIFPTQPSLGSVTVKLLTNCQHFVNRISNKSELNKNSALVFGVFLFTLTESLLFHFLMYPPKQAGNRKEKNWREKVTSNLVPSPSILIISCACQPFNGWRNHNLKLMSMKNILRNVGNSKKNIKDKTTVFDQTTKTLQFSIVL